MRLRENNPRLDQRPARPWQSHAESLIDRSLASNFASDDALRQLPPPFVRAAFPERTGFRKIEPTIQDVLNIDRYAPSNRAFTSGFPAKYHRGERVYTQGEQSGQAGARNSMGTMW